MYATQDRYLGNPMYPERGPHGNTTAAAASSSATPSPSSNVTNHVGNIGVMSAAATPLSEWMEELRHQDDHHDHDHDHEGHRHSHSTISSVPSVSQLKHTRIARRPTGADAAAPAAAPPAMDDEAIRARLRAHMFAGKKGSRKREERAGTTAAASAAIPRHSGVQVEILRMYRSMLREVRRMDDLDTRRNLTAYIRSEFDKHRDVPRKNILKIEWQLNYGKRKLEDLQAMSPHTKFTMMR
jgi:hypothetical protein